MKMKCWVFTVEVTGYGKDKDSAFEDALENGIGNVDDFIKATRNKEEDFEEE